MGQCEEVGGKAQLSKGQRDESLGSWAAGRLEMLIECV